MAESGSEAASESKAPAGKIQPRRITLADLGAVLTAGWRDFIAHPQYGLFFAAFYALGGGGILYAALRLDALWWLIPAMGGFPLLAPFAAVGLYEVSRRRESGEPLSWRAVLGALKGRGDDQLLMMGGIIFVAFSFWMILAHAIFAIFVGESGIGSGTAGLLLSPEALAMLAVGGAVGAAFALALFATTVTSLPMLVERDVDFITAIIASVGSVKASPGAMLGWAAFIAIALTLAMVPLFLGLLIVLPVLGHATWHLYRRVLGVS